MQPDFEQFSISLFFIVVLTSLVIAFWKGGQPEKFGAALLSFIGIVQFFAYSLFPPRLDSVDLVALFVDALAFLGFGWIAIHARRVWPIWAAAFQLLSVASHFARFVELGIEPWVYAILKSGPTGFAALLLIIGTLLHQRRIAIDGEDVAWMDWRNSGQNSSKN